MLEQHHFLGFALLQIFFALHSFFAAGRVKAWFASWMGGAFRFYRLIYNVLNLGVLFAVLFWLFAQTEDFLFEKFWLTTFLGRVGLTLGLSIMVLSLLKYGLGEFTGVSQAASGEASAAHSQLNTEGLNAVVRHPLYLGLVLALVGFFLVYPKMGTLVFLVGTLVYLPVGIFWEEKKLEEQFGEAYRDYQKRVRKLIPGVW